MNGSGALLDERKKAMLSKAKVNKFLLKDGLPVLTQKRRRLSKRIRKRAIIVLNLDIGNRITYAY